MKPIQSNPITLYPDLDLKKRKTKIAKRCSNQQSRDKIMRAYNACNPFSNQKSFEFVINVDILRLSQDNLYSSYLIVLCASDASKR